MWLLFSCIVIFKHCCFEVLLFSNIVVFKYCCLKVLLSAASIRYLSPCQQFVTFCLFLGKGWGLKIGDVDDDDSDDDGDDDDSAAGN